MPDSKPTWRDSLLKVFRAKDETEKEAAIAEMEAAEADENDVDGGQSEGDNAVHHHIEINMPTSGPAADDKPKDANEGGEEGKQPNKDVSMTKDEMEAAIASAVSEAVEGATAPLLAKIDALTEAMDDLSDPEDVGTQDAIGRAEILAPGINRPTMDAAPGSKAHRDAMGSFQRDALKRALTTDAGRAAVSAVLGHARPDLIARMPANEVAIAFRGASQIMFDQNAATAVNTLASATTGYVRDEKGQRVRPMTTADLAQIHRDHYAAQRRA